MTYAIRPLRLFLPSHMYLFCFTMQWYCQSAYVLSLIIILMLHDIDKSLRCDIGVNIGHQYKFGLWVFVQFMDAIKWLCLLEKQKFNNHSYIYCGKLGETWQGRKLQLCNTDEDIVHGGREFTVPLPNLLYVSVCARQHCTRHVACRYRSTW